MKKKFTGILVAALALACVVGTSTKADAAFVAAICNDLACAGGDDFIVLDNNGNLSGGGAVNDTAAGVGMISYNTSAFGYSFLVNTSQSKPAIGSASAPQLDLSYTATRTTTCTTGCDVFLYASDTDFVGAHGFLLTIGGTDSATGTVTGRAWGGTNNTALAFSGANLLGTLGPFTAASYNGSLTGNITPTVTPYSLTIGVAINLTTPGTATGDLNLKVPEPASMTLFGLGLMGFGVASRRRKANQAK